MGHSMGGLIALALALDSDKTTGLQGVISSGNSRLPTHNSNRQAPALQPGSPIPKFKLGLGRLVSRIAPRFTVDNGLDISNIARDQKEIDDFVADQLCTMKISLQTGMLLMIETGTNDVV